MGTPRNFKCPLTYEPCIDGRCKKDILCIARELDKAADSTADESARERRIRTGQATPEDFGL